MTQLRYVNDYGNGHSGYIDYTTIDIATAPNTYVDTRPNGPVGTDAFGRIRISDTLTLFDSSHRYQDNGLWATATGTGGTYAFSSNEGLVNMNVTTVSGAQVLRETTKVCSYQPGKSLLIINTFVMNTAKANLRQRVGYFGEDNGIYFQINGLNEPEFVQRSLVTGTVTETLVPQSQWNIDPLNGRGPSGVTLDPTKAQIFWMDIEWLGLGTVRVGFVVDGKLIHCHSFHHANFITSTYITTASLPLRYEITNVGTTASSSTLKQICSTALSEGGYELRGAQLGIALPVATPRDLTNASTEYPVISVRLKSTALDGIVILTALSVMGITNNANYSWKIIANGTTTGGAWVSAGTGSAVEYNITGTSFSSTGARILATGFFNGTNRGAVPVDVLKEALFKFQLERNSFTDTPYELTLVVDTDSAGSDVLASLDFEEISR